MHNYFLNIFKYPYDVSGIAATNLIINEPYTRDSIVPTPIVPKQRAFYIDSMVVVDNATALPLTLGTDYTFDGYSDDLTAASGKEVAHAIVLTDKNWTGTYLLTYQCVGGPQGNANELITDLLDAIGTATANPNISWLSLLGKPERFPPAEHMHDLTTLGNQESLKQTFDDFINALVNTKPLGLSGQSFQEQLDGTIKIQGQMQNAINKLAMYAASGQSITALQDKVDALYKLEDASFSSDALTPITILEIADSVGTSLKGVLAVTDGVDAWQAEIYVTWVSDGTPDVNYLVGASTNDAYYPSLTATNIGNTVTVSVTTLTTSTIKVKWGHLL